VGHLRNLSFQHLEMNGMSESPSSHATARILLLEDDLLLAMDMEDYLVQGGHQVIGPFGRIGEALEAIPQSDLSGAIIDLNLRGELSFPVIELLQAQAVPFIVCSGYAELPELKRRLNGVPLLPKPWSPEALSGLMKATFGF
jgi:DNA-binding response OmpR family regulator